MRKLSLIVALCLMTLSGWAQDEEESLGKKIEELTTSWDNASVALNSYEGLSKFCVSPEYRQEIIDLLNGIHHYDSVLYDRLVKLARHSNNKEVTQTLKDIEKLEQEYDMKSFLHFLHEECVRRSDLEKHAATLKNDIGENSLDGQIYLIETELNKYIKHITKAIDNIRVHTQHLHIK